METYIIRICRRREKRKSEAFAGIVEDVERDKKRRFSDSDKLLKILKLEKGRMQKKKSSMRKRSL